MQKAAASRQNVKDASGDPKRNLELVRVFAV
jgi:hypothetical protein